MDGWIFDASASISSGVAGGLAGLLFSFFNRPFYPYLPNTFFLFLQHVFIPNFF